MAGGGELRKVSIVSICIHFWLASRRGSGAWVPHTGGLEVPPSWRAFLRGGIPIWSLVIPGLFRFLMGASRGKLLWWCLLDAT